MDSHSAQQGGPTARLTVAFYPPQWAAEMRGAPLGRLDARLLHLHARTPQGTLCAVLHDSARLLGAHLTYRCQERHLSAAPWSDGGTQRGVPLGLARHALMLPGTPRPQAPAPLARTLLTWTHGTLLIVQAGQVCEHLNLADELDRLHLPHWLEQGLDPRAHVTLHAHRLRPGGRLEQWLTRLR
ncbi:hypothetical protein GCM10008959_35060 [Deinococcus seoulensis]|uniref:Uncharacterized protein n=1 Tax=Deinococcus seoulensis TaxID=1837379 RepID=A0ABQ2RVB9_9DEIO|nr:hypothetical protein [Deinococcus seoulensis]GGR70327.1 hypothetical protein GCM10008959_35060 [Deinococcus seoulensis]